MKMLAVKFDETEEQENENLTVIEETVQLTDMHFIYCGEFEDDEKEKNLRFVVGAHTSKGEMVLFSWLFKCGEDDTAIMNKLKDSEFFDGPKFGDRNLALVNFFINNMLTWATDFISTYNQETTMYEFTGFTADAENKQYKGTYSISSNMRVGLELLLKSIKVGSLTKDNVMEINTWLSGNTKIRDFNGYKSITDFTIKDISRTSKVNNNLYSGIVALDFKLESPIDDKKTITCIMSYFRDKKLRTRDKTIDLSLMETVYKDAFIVGNYGGSIIGSNENDTTLIVYDSTKEKYTALVFSGELYNKFAEEIKAI